MEKGGDGDSTALGTQGWNCWGHKHLDSGWRNTNIWILHQETFSETLCPAPLSAELAEGSFSWRSSDIAGEQGSPMEHWIWNFNQSSGKWESAETEGFAESLVLLQPTSLQVVQNGLENLSFPESQVKTLNFHSFVNKTRRGVCVFCLEILNSGFWKSSSKAGQLNGVCSTWVWISVMGSGNGCIHSFFFALEQPEEPSQIPHDWFLPNPSRFFFRNFLDARF